MKITWYGTASLVIESGNTSLVFDPYLKDLPKGRETEEEFETRKKALAEHSNVLITHGHFDHLSDIKKIYGDLDCTVYLTKTPLETLTKEKFEQSKMREIKFGDSLDFQDFNVKVLKGKHITFVKKEIAKEFALGIFKKTFFKDFSRAMRIGVKFLKYPENDQTVFYEIEVEGKTVQIMGSADLDSEVDYKIGADLLILPHQGRGDIDEHNKKIVERLQPKRILLDHYDDAFPPYSADVPLDNFINEVSKSIPTDKLIEGVTVEI